MKLLEGDVNFYIKKSFFSCSSKGNLPKEKKKYYLHKIDIF